MDILSGIDTIDVVGVVAATDGMGAMDETAETGGLHLQMNETTDSHPRRTTRMYPQAQEPTEANQPLMALLLLHPPCLHLLYPTQTNNNPPYRTLPLPTPLR